MGDGLQDIHCAFKSTCMDLVAFASIVRVYTVNA